MDEPTIGLEKTTMSGYLRLWLGVGRLFFVRLLNDELMLRNTSFSLQLFATLVWESFGSAGFQIMAER